MTTIQYREVIVNGTQHVEIVDEQQAYDLHTFSIVCGQSPEWILKLIEYDILPQRNTQPTPHFIVDDISRAQRAYRLQRDFDASFTAVAMMLDLLDELQQLRRSQHNAAHRP